MEENVALDSSKQKKFNKSIKKLLNKKNAEPKTKNDGEGKVKSGRVGKKKRKQRGLVYLGHIPHGFYEHQMTQYFKQFGVVTNARVIKSKRTGRSKGFAFVEFKEPTVAQVVAETMNNYLMGKRLIKASYIPPEKQKRAFRKHWNAVNNPGNEIRMKTKKAFNANRDEKGELQIAKKLLANIAKTKQKLKELGINYDFFTPVDVPEQLENGVHLKKEDGDLKAKKSIKKGEIKKEPKVKTKVEQDTIGPTKNKKPKQEIEQDTIKPTKNKKPKKEIEEVKPTKTKKSLTKETKTEEDDLQQKKKDKLKGRGVRLLEDFMEVKQDSDNDSDSSEAFDSDEFEKMMQSDDEDDLESDESGTESEEDASETGSEESEEELPTKKNKAVVPKVVSVQSKKIVGKQQHKKPQPQNIQESKQHHTKRQLPQKTEFNSAKKPKFEKKTSQKPRNKQFKKK